MKRPSPTLISMIALAAALGLAAPAMAAPADAGRPSSEAQATPPMSGSAQMQRGQRADRTGKSELAHWAQNKRVKDITGQSLYDGAGKRLGTIDAVVLNNATTEPMAVVDAGGGFLGIGGKDVTLPLADIEMAGGKLIAPTIVSASQLKARPAFRKSQFTEITANQKLSDFSAFEAKPSPPATKGGGVSQPRPAGEHGQNP
jgi:hypothetical protein